MYKKLSIIGVLMMFAFSIACAQDDDGPNLTLKAMSSTVDSGKVVKISVNSNQPLAKLTANMISIDGGNIESVRKLSSYSYLIFIRAGDSREIDVQIEASVVQNRNTKAYNSYASNNVVVGVNAPPVSTADSSNQLSKILDTVQSVIQQNNQAAQQAVQTNQQAVTQVQYYYCNGYQIPTTQACNQSPYVTNQYNPYGTVQSVYDPVSGTYVNPYTGQPVANPYNYNYYNSYNPYGVYNYNTNYNTGLTPYYSTSPLGNFLNGVNYGLNGNNNQNTGVNPQGQPSTTFRDPNSGDTYSVYDER